MSEENPAPANDSEDSPRTQAGLADERFAINIRERRELAEMSQADLAKEMASRGFHWHPQTVHKVETGVRKVSVGEGKALAEIFGTTVEWLTWPGRAASTAAILSDFTSRGEVAAEQIAAHTRSLLQACFQLELTTSEAEQGDYLGSAEIRRLVEYAREAMKLTPEDAVASGRADWESLHARGDAEPECPPPLPAEDGAGL